MSRQEFEARFPDDDACARYLAERRWPDGFVCPACGGRKGGGAGSGEADVGMRGVPTADLGDRRHDYALPPPCQQE